MAAIPRIELDHVVEIRVHRGEDAGNVGHGQARLRDDVVGVLDLAGRIARHLRRDKKHLAAAYALAEFASLGPWPVAVRRGNATWGPAVAVVYRDRVDDDGHAGIGKPRQGQQRYDRRQIAADALSNMAKQAHLVVECSAGIKDVQLDDILEAASERVDDRLDVIQRSVALRQQLTGVVDVSGGVEIRLPTDEDQATVSRAVAMRHRNLPIPGVRG